MKIELKKIKIGLAFSEETTCFNAEIYINGVNAGFAKNDGRGGSTDYCAHADRNGNRSEANWDLIGKAEAYCRTLPPIKVSETFSLDMTLEHFIDEIIEDELKKKDKAAFEKNFKKGLVVEDKHGINQIITWKKIDIAGLLNRPDGRATLKSKINELRQEGCKILNTNIPDEILGIVKK